MKTPRTLKGLKSLPDPTNEQERNLRVLQLFGLALRQFPSSPNQKETHAEILRIKAIEL